VAYKKRSDNLFSTDNLQVIEPPENKYQADPFSFTKNGLRYLFIEDYDYNLGEIACCEIREDGSLSDFETIIKDNYHFSYPFLFEYDNDIWMIPETARENRIELHRCVKFPNEWEKVKTLLNVSGADSTVISTKDGKLCMFTTIGPDDNVTIFVADNPLGPWSFHSSTTHQHSRSAGRIFQYGNKIIRPTQDCSKCYGHALVFKEIELTSFGYQESVFGRIEPTWYPGLIGTHTFNFDDEYVYVDGKVQVT